MSIQRHARRLSAAALAVGMGLVLLLGPLASPASAATAAPQLDTTFANLLNTLRTTLGASGLTLDAELSNVARNWSVQMANAGTLSHNPSVTGQVGGWAKLGENVGTGGAVTQIFDALVKSPPHMRNMSDPEFTRIGIGTVKDASGRLWTTHVFMRPKTAAAPAPAPAPRVAPATTAKAPATTKAPAPRPTATTAAPTTVPPTTAAPVTTVPPTTVAPVVEAAASGLPTEATALLDTPLLTPTAASQVPSKGVPPFVVGAAALVALLVLGSGGFVLRRLG